MEGEGADQVAGDYGLHHHLGGVEHDHHGLGPVEEVVAIALDASFIVRMRLILSYGLYFHPCHLQANYSYVLCNVGLFLGPMALCMTTFAITCSGCPR